MLLNDIQKQITALATEDGSQVPDRDDIPAEYKWHLDDIYKTEEDWQKDYEKVKNTLPEIGNYTDHVGKSAEYLLSCLELRDNINMIVEKLYNYAQMHRDENTAENKYQALFGKAQSLQTEVSAATAFIEPEITAIPDETISQYRQQETSLQKYSFYLDNLVLQKKHVLSHREEEILSRATGIAQVPETIYGILSDADLKFPYITDENNNKVQLSEGRYATFRTSSDRRVRKEAFEGFLGSYSDYRNTFAATLDGLVKQHIFFAKARNYDSCLEASLAPNNIPIGVYDNLITTVNNNLEPLHRFVRLKKKILGLDEMHIYDLYTPMAQNVEFKTPYAEGLDLVRDALTPLGPDYLKNFNGGISSGWVDVYENKGKRTGAYMQNVYGVHPFVLLNYNNQLDDASTLAHEMGHAMHSYYSCAKQAYPTANTAIFTAETASTTNEILFIDYMLKKTTDKQKKLYLLSQYLENIRLTLYRQTMFAEFEKIIHEKGEQGETLTADMLEAIYHDLNVKYFGPDMIVDKQNDVEWARIPHFYYNFYVYQYATGYSAATALAAQLQTEGVPAQDCYIHNFLEAGCSDTPINILKQAGIDMSSPEPIKMALEKFNNLLDENENYLCL